jgi:hypothetical protein
MSIVIIAMTPTAAIVAADSKMNNHDVYQRMPKIYKYNSQMAFYGAGNAGVVNGFFRAVNNMYNDLGDKAKDDDALRVMSDWEQHMRTVPEFQKLSASIGVCSCTGFWPHAQAAFIDEQKHEPIKLTPGKELSWLIIPPVDVPTDICRNIFTSHIASIPQQPSAPQLIDLCSKTIRNVSMQSDVVGPPIQYWTYNTLTGLSSSSLLSGPR